MKTIKPGTYVKLAAWTWSYAIFDTVRNSSQTRGSLRNAEESFERAERNGHDTAFAIYTGTMLVDDPSGAWHRREAERFASAVELVDGETVAVEGEPETYRVRVVRGNEKSPRNSDPIHFEKIAN